MNLIIALFWMCIVFFLPEIIIVISLIKLIIESIQDGSSKNEVSSVMVCKTQSKSYLKNGTCSDINGPIGMSCNNMNTDEEKCDIDDKVLDWRWFTDTSQSEHETVYFNGPGQPPTFWNDDGDIYGGPFFGV